MDEQRFTDEQVTKACGLHIDNLRRLITWGAVRPVQAGGGRGRVRLWTFAQAMRIAATTEFVEAGFSLQMAHTLTYCLPLDDLLALYDPDFLKNNVNLNHRQNVRLNAMLAPAGEGESYWPGPEYTGHIVVIDRRLVYADVLGDTYQLYGLIHPELNLYYPVWDPRYAYFGPVTEGTQKRRPAIKNVEPSSLLLNDVYRRTSPRRLSRYMLKISKNVDSQIDDPEDHFYRHCLRLNLGVGLTVAFRKLLGFPASCPNHTELVDD